MIIKGVYNISISRWTLLIVLKVTQTYGKLYTYQDSKLHNDRSEVSI